MGSIIDPITGLPYDALDTTLYSIPLDSQPYLAPEWNPQGRINTSVYPDNGPSVFATGQAQNELNPKTVQAMTTDGAGNLNVNVKAGGGGGGGRPGSITPTSFGTGATTPGSTGDQNFSGPFFDIPIVYQVSLAAIVWTDTLPTPDSRQLGLFFSAFPPNVQFFVRDWMPNLVQESPSGLFVATINELITFDPGLNLATLSRDPTSVDLNFRSGAFHQYAICEAWSGPVS